MKAPQCGAFFILGFEESAPRFEVTSGTLRELRRSDLN